MKLTINNANLYVEEQGQGTPVILLHGFPLDHQMWKLQIEALSSAYRVIAPDLRGMGQSDVPDSNISLDQYADDVLALMDKLNIQKAALGGFSMGGYIAFSLLRKAPERFSALVLANTRPEADGQDGRKNRLNMAVSLYDKGPAAARDVMLPKLLTEQTRQSDPQLVDELNTVMGSMPAEGLIHASLAMAFRGDSVDLLSSIAVPTLVIVGEEDPITPPSVMKKMADQIKGSSYHVLPAASHLTPLEQPEAFNTLLLDFLKNTNI
ncbi:alpha/beta fold hydrolase [Paenibacillus sp. SYP-B3998]|uniref:Alpha/beta fold hydrolase n=1 Tax=Paenibacillus sp. SYP-B3998 TaxID=2678564 RepID=A0A6G4A6C8_9BACL|nr:alpha/beta fold hydrolase [Paenibacillus sp. SYP-B3998]NEW09848.1 alpha/beta fold hydrolase [Paenibacillus sp. SYP-B3998]